jgi:hypothetical protein
MRVPLERALPCDCLLFFGPEFGRDEIVAHALRWSNRKRTETVVWNGIAIKIDRKSRATRVFFDSHAVGLLCSQPQGVHSALPFTCVRYPTSKKQYSISDSRGKSPCTRLFRNPGTGAYCSSATVNAEGVLGREVGIMSVD